MAEIKTAQKPATLMTGARIRLPALAVLGTLAAFTAQAGTYPPDVFGWNLASLHLNGGSFIANKMLLSDFGQIVVNPETGAFAEAGYLRFSVSRSTGGDRPERL